MSYRVILTSLNDNVDKLNEANMVKSPGVGKTYLSADSVADEDMANTYHTGFLSLWHASSFHDTEGWSSCYVAAKSDSWPWQ